MDERDQVRPVVDDHVRVGVEHRADPRVVCRDGLPLLGPRLDARLAERGDRVVVGGERVAGRQAHVGASRPERERERGRLRLYVEHERIGSGPRNGFSASNRRRIPSRTGMCARAQSIF